MIMVKACKSKRQQKKSIVVFHKNKPCIPPASRDASTRSHDFMTYGKANQPKAMMLGIRNIVEQTKLIQALLLLDTER